MSRLTVSVSPHIRGRETTRRIMLDVIIAMVPALAAACVIFGMRSLLLTAASALFCAALEHVWCLIRKTPSTAGDLSAVVTGMLLAFNVPVGMPLWQLFVGDAIAILVVKMLFGGIGCNFVNPALVGRVAMMFSFPGSMTDYAVGVAKLDALSGATPLASAGQLGWDAFPALLLGQYGGVLGETCAAALLAGGVYLVIRKVIRPWLPLVFIGTTALFTWLFGGSAPILGMFSGGLLLGAIFMATDYVTSPVTEWGRVIFGAGCGLITAAIRVFGNATEGVSFAILLMNLIVPYLNQITRPKAFGEVKAQ